ncbi:hypothetical protein SB659_20425, partial [Arthrobacter sp. SIMBA_036]|uniref:hypothetical protein n=1 Tax=Arthrobacter sp. SIMBA_036 TaxID=3085778 RepID=UPI003979A250
LEPQTAGDGVDRLLLRRAETLANNRLQTFVDLHRRYQFDPAQTGRRDGAPVAQLKLSSRPQKEIAGSMHVLAAYGDVD